MTGRCMIVDISRCIGCQTCVIACKAATGTGPGLFRSVLRSLPEGSEPGEKTEKLRFFGVLPLRLSCLHCEPAPCADVCPAGALYRMDGLTVLDPETCLGCGKCVSVCPWKLIGLGRRNGVYDFPLPGRGIVVDTEDDGGKDALFPPAEPGRERVADKCTFCVSMNTEQTPVCALACPMGAILFGDPADPVFAGLWMRAHCLPGSEGLHPRLRFLRSFSGEEGSPD